MMEENVIHEEEMFFSCCRSFRKLEVQLQVQAVQVLMDHVWGDGAEGQAEDLKVVLPGLHAL